MRDMPDDTAIERFSPLLLHSVLGAVRRFEPDFYAHICRAHHVDADRILGLFSEIEELGPAQMIAILREIREHQAYHDIVFLAGRNALHLLADQQRLRAGLLSFGAAARFSSLLKQVLPPFLGLSSFVHLVRGDLQFVELRDSVFARDAFSVRPLCGFYCGLFTELGALTGSAPAQSSEMRCRAMDAEAQSCLIQMSL